MITEIYKSPISDKNSLIIKFCKNKKVLDVGCVGQDKSFNNPEWIHSKIKSISASLIGTDINFDEVLKLNNNGYNIVTPDKLDIDIKYQIITILDVIEHVDNVVEFLEYYSKFLDKDGKILITTPNPFNIRQILNIMLFKLPSVNEEHTVWIDPINFLEISKRSKLEVVEFYWLNEYFNHTKFYWKAITIILLRPLQYFRRYFLPNYAVILKKI